MKPGLMLNKKVFLSTWIVLCYLTCIQFGYCQKKLFVISYGTKELVSYNLNQEDPVKKRVGNERIELSYELVYDPDENQLYWLDNIGKKVGRIGPGGTQSVKLNIEGLDTPVDIELDWINKKLYWIDYKFKKIFRSNLNGKQIQEFQFDSLMLRPSSVAVSPEDNLIFWSDMGLRKVFAATLDSRQVREIASDLGTPVRIILDKEKKRIYWSDDRAHRIYSSNFMGTDQRILYEGGAEEHPFSLFLDKVENKLYWADYGLDIIQRANPDGSEVEVVIEEGLDDPSGIVVVHQPVQPISVENPSFSIHSNLGLFPNPTKGTITLFLSQDYYEDAVFSVFDLYGRLVKERPMISNPMDISLDDLPEGNYLFRVKGLQKIYTGKLILTR